MTPLRHVAGPPTTRTAQVPDASRPQRPLRVGISACLLGEAVRFDGGHKRDRFLTDTLGPFVDWVPVCPEVECGLGTPREAMRLVGTPAGVRLRTTRTGQDLTERIEQYAVQRLAALADEDLCGYVLKKDSPSCGMERVRVYDAHCVPERVGRGLFAARLIESFPHLPVEEEGRLSDPLIRENFVGRVFACWRLRGLFGGAWDAGALVRFHTAHKLLLLAHSPEAYRQLGRLVAAASDWSRQALERRYTEMFMAALAVMATRRRHVNVLQHMQGYFTRRIDGDARAELLAAIDEYRRGFLPLVVPLTLIRHHVRTRRVPYLAGQIYLEPYPSALMLRNHV